MDSNLIPWLQDWYAAQCDGDWEHQHGIEISTLDNPGWMVTIDLTETGLEAASFETVDETSRSEKDWVYCEVKDSSFRGAGGSHNLLEIMRIFRSWVEGQES